MAKDESKKEKKSKRKSDAALTDAGDVSAMSVDSIAPAEKKIKKEKKSKTQVEDDGIEEEGGRDIPIDAISPIAQPLAQRKLSKKVFKTIKKASKQRGHVKRGVKEVVKGLRKGDKGLVILAGDISPIDILSHIPVLCEDTDNPYIFVTSKDALGLASSTKRPTSCVMIVPGGSKKAGAQKAKNGADAGKEEYAEDYETVYGEIKTLGEKVLLNVA